MDRDNTQDMLALLIDPAALYLVTDPGVTPAQSLQNFVLFFKNNYNGFSFSFFEGGGSWILAPNYPGPRIFFFTWDLGPIHTGRRTQDATRNATEANGAC